jgi:putative endonuclease
MSRNLGGRISRNLGGSIRLGELPQEHQSGSYCRICHFMYFTYILQSLLDNSFYIGCTEDLTIRLNEHNSGLSKYTSKKIPCKLVYYEEFNTFVLVVHRV